jgi:hypothetical protein
MHAHSETDAVLQCNLVVQAFILEVQLVHCTVAVFSQARTDSHLIICHSHVVSYAYGCFNTLPQQWNSVTTLVGLCTFLVHARILGRSLSASQGFTALSLFNLLRFPLLVLPDVFNFFFQVNHCNNCNNIVICPRILIL